MIIFSAISSDLIDQVVNAGYQLTGISLQKDFPFSENGKNVFLAEAIANSFVTFFELNATSLAKRIKTCNFLSQSQSPYSELRPLNPFLIDPNRVPKASEFLYYCFFYDLPRITNKYIFRHCL